MVSPVGSVRGGSSALKAGQGGYLLLEALISMLLFSVAMLGIIGLYAASVRNNSEAEYRFEASYLASELVGRMRSDDRDPATLKADYEGADGTGGSKYLNWVGEITDTSRLPGLATYPPEVAVTTLDGAAPPDTSKSQVTITIRWQLPNAASVHNHVLTTLISQ
jgi:type IV pilus assembly protein PilV